jgi:glycoside/pentoside/hexuronide:cation symporter, GPH family
MLTKREYIGFSIGGVGHNLIARVWDAFCDPLMGMIADRSSSRFGRYRVWLMRAAPIIGVCLALCFFVPQLSKALQYVYCYATYVLLGMAFTMADIPYWTLPSVMTADGRERNKLFSLGALAGSAAAFALGIIRYVPNEAQAQSTKDALHALVSIFPGIIYAIAALVLLGYPLGKDKFAELERRLGQKREGGA